MNDNEKNSFADMAIAAIRRAKPGETMIVVVASDTGAVQQVFNPVPMRLCHAASSLLDSAADELPEGSALRDDIADVIDILPDRFAEEDA